MTTIAQQATILNAYEEWVEGMLIGGVDTSAEAYVAHLEHEENARIIQGVREILNDPKLELGLRIPRIASLFPDQKETA